MQSTCEHHALLCTRGKGNSQNPEATAKKHHGDILNLAQTLVVLD